MQSSSRILYFAQGCLNVESAHWAILIGHEPLVNTISMKQVQTRQTSAKEIFKYRGR